LDDRVILGNVSYQFGIMRALKMEVLGNLEAISENVAALRCIKGA